MPCSGVPPDKPPPKAQGCVNDISNTAKGATTRPAATFAVTIKSISRFMTLQEEITTPPHSRSSPTPTRVKPPSPKKLLLPAVPSTSPGRSKATRSRKAPRPDFMEIERQRGISVATAVMGFEIQGHQDQYPRHPGPRGLRRRHLPHADGRRFGDHRHRRCQRASSREPAN